MTAVALAFNDDNNKKKPLDVALVPKGKKTRYMLYRRYIGGPDYTIWNAVFITFSSEKNMLAFVKLQNKFVKMNGSGYEYKLPEFK